MANEKFEQWKEKVGYDFERLDPKVINADLQCEKPTSYDFSRVGYQAGRKDRVKEVLRDLRRFAQYVVKEGTCTKEDIFNLIDHKYEEIGEPINKENSNGN